MRLRNNVFAFIYFGHNITRIEFVNYDSNCARALQKRDSLPALQGEGGAAQTSVEYSS
jgi:hypothetical protein